MQSTNENIKRIFLKKELADKPTAHGTKVRVALCPTGQLGPNQTGRQVTRACGVHPHPTTLLKPSSKEFDEPQKEEMIKTPQGASRPSIWDKE